jgi:hypothetical protein
MDRRGREEQINGKKLLIKSFMVCTHYKSRTMKWPENVAHMDEKRDTARYFGAKF